MTLPVLGVDLGPGVRAGFTTRAGGVSAPPWDALDLGLNVRDDPADVRANRARVAAWAGAPVAWATQVHGADVHVLRGPGDAAGDTVGEVDALVSAVPGTAVGVLVADCVPVLLADRAAGVVGAAHAGRRGLVSGVVQAALAAMVDLGAEPGRVRAVVGPAISGARYEVPAAMRDEVEAAVPGTACTTDAGTPGLDLSAGVAAVLRGAGVGDVRLTGLCTDRDQRFFSHRRAQRAGTTTGRFAGVVAVAEMPGA
ncbi:peptidoglycan editing factor PgeF [Cellulomonas pakistanensis]|uniref:Purine nucleoside phosphorylase n=1 Tax=Cellulomonas pakistanensis TaxID=992287 RepID=A0A919PCW1_9CELL|nr:peptidoglycan editing factor PgeF [Cellulomonas pakistanensis]GIG37250.1 laccase domain protein [Cellulomonas pakistanensis]